MRFTLPPCLAMLKAWYVMRGLRPMSPRTRTWTTTPLPEEGPAYLEGPRTR